MKSIERQADRGYGEQAYIELITPEILTDQIVKIVKLDGNALLNTLTPHHQLAEMAPFDPAGYVISSHKIDSPSGSEAEKQKTDYDLGVMFGRSLLLRALANSEIGMPVVSDFDMSKKLLVSLYLVDSRKRKLSHIIRDNFHRNPELHYGAKTFSYVCDYLDILSNKEELMRGYHDFFNVVTLLDTPEDAQQDALRRALGRTGLIDRLAKSHPLMHARRVV